MFCYHSTSLRDPGSGFKRDALGLLRSIRDKKYLEPRTKHVINQTSMFGLSVSRSRAYALGERLFGNVVLELDYNRLRHHNRVIPIDGNISFVGQQNHCIMSFGSSDFEHLCNLYRDRQGILPSCEDFVIGPIKNFRRCINHIYLLADYRTESEDTLELFEELVVDLNIPYTVESNPGDIQLTDVIKLHTTQRKAA